MSLKANFCSKTEYDSHKNSRIVDLEQRGAENAKEPKGPRLLAMFALTSSNPETGAASTDVEIIRVTECESGLLVASVVLMDMELRPYGGPVTALVDNGLWTNVRAQPIVINGTFPIEAYFRRQGDGEDPNHTLIGASAENAEHATKPPLHAVPIEEQELVSV